MATNPALAKRVRSGLGWSLASTVGNRLWSIVSNIILARILVPDDYGVFAIAFLVLTLLQSVNECGVTVAVIRWAGDPTPILGTAMVIAMGGSAILFSACFLGAATFAEAVHSPSAAPILRVLTLGILLDGMSSIPSALLARQMRQKRRALIDGIALVVASVMSVVLATQGFGAWSLAWGTLAGNAVATALLWSASPTRPRPAWDTGHARVLLRTGLPIAGASLMVLAMLNVDYVTVSRLLGTRPLGFYVLAFNISSWLPSLISASVRKVSIPAFSQVDLDDEQRRRIFLQSLRAIITAAALIGLLVSALSSPIVRIMYGTKWESSIAPLRWLAVLGVIRVTLDFCYDYLIAHGASRAVLLSQAVWLAVLIPAIRIGAQVGGLTGVGIAHVTVGICIAIPAFFLALGTTGVQPKKVLNAVRLPAAATLCAVGVGVAFNAFIGSRSPWMFGGILLAIVVYFIIAVQPAEARLMARRLHNALKGTRRA